MEYRRLTKRRKDGSVALDFYSNSKDFTINELKLRLAELEDQIEAGTLMELPCKVGDIIYAVNAPRVANVFGFTPPSVEEYVVTGIRMYEDELLRRFNTQIECYPLVFGPYNYGKHTFNIDDIFLNEAEAEKRLEEIRNENEN